MAPAGDCSENSTALGVQGSQNALPTICVLGSIGAGKGSTLNALFNIRTNDLFHSRLLASESLQPVSHVRPWQGCGEHVRGVDIPGCADSFGRDVYRTPQLIAYLEEQVKYVHCFLIVFHAQEPCLGQQLRNILLAMKETFGCAFLKHTVLGFTRWDYRERAQIGQSAYSRLGTARAVNRTLQSLLGHAHELKAVFLDNTLNMSSEKELDFLHTDELPALRLAFEKEIQEVHCLVSSNRAFQCRNIQREEADMTNSILSRRHARAMVAFGKESYNRLVQNWKIDCEYIHEADVLVKAMSNDVQQELDTLRGNLKGERWPGLESMQVCVEQDFQQSIASTTKTLCEHNEHRKEEKKRNIVNLSKEALEKLEEKWEADHKTPKDPVELGMLLETEMQEELEALTQRLKCEAVPGLEAAHSSASEEFCKEVSAMIANVCEENEVRAKQAITTRKYKVLHALGNAAHDRLIKKWEMDPQGFEDSSEMILKRLVADKHKEAEDLVRALESEAKPDLESVVPLVLEEFHKHVAVTMNDVIQRSYGQGSKTPKTNFLKSRSAESPTNKTNRKFSVSAPQAARSKSIDLLMEKGSASQIITKPAFNPTSSTSSLKTMEEVEAVGHTLAEDNVHSLQTSTKKPLDLAMAKRKASHIGASSVSSSPSATRSLDQARVVGRLPADAKLPNSQRSNSKTDAKTPTHAHTPKAAHLPADAKLPNSQRSNSKPDAKTPKHAHTPKAAHKAPGVPMAKRGATLTPTSSAHKHTK